MYNSTRTGNHGSLRPGDRVSGGSSRVYNRQPDSDFRQGRAKLQGSLRRGDGLHSKSLQSPQRMPEPAQPHEQCLWCAGKQTGCETLARLFQGPGLLCPECEKKLKPKDLVVTVSDDLLEGPKQFRPDQQERQKRGRGEDRDPYRDGYQGQYRNPYQEKKPKKSKKKKIYVLYENNSETERLLRRILQYGDLDPARIFLENYPQYRKLLAKVPIKAVGMSFRSPAFQAFFSGIRLKSAFAIEQAKGSLVSYLAASLLPLTDKQIAWLLSDPYCVGLWMLVQDPEWIEKHQKKNKPDWEMLFETISTHIK